VKSQPFSNLAVKQSQKSLAMHIHSPSLAVSIWNQPLGCSSDSQDARLEDDNTIIWSHRSLTLGKYIIVIIFTDENRSQPCNIDAQMHTCTTLSSQCSNYEIDWARFNVPPNTL